MTRGPIDFVALSFKGNNFRGEILSDLKELVDNNVIAIIDLVIVRKDHEGELAVTELKELDDQTIGLFSPMKFEVTSMVTREDIEKIGQMLENDSTTAVMLFENLWAIKLKQAIIDANGRLVMQERIPHEVVEEAERDIAQLASTAA